MTRKPSVWFYVSMAAMIAVTMVMHEAAHYLTGKALGYDMFFVLTYTSILGDGYQSDLDYQIISAAGPIFTLSMGLFGAWLAISKKALFGYELVFVAAFQRLLAMVFSGLGTQNDEARISMFLGWEWWMLPAIVVATLWALTIWSSISLRLGFLVNFLCYVTASLSFLVIVYADGQLFSNRPSIVEPLLSENVQSVLADRRGE